MPNGETLWELYKEGKWGVSQPEAPVTEQTLWEQYKETGSITPPEPTPEFVLPEGFPKDRQPIQVEVEGEAHTYSLDAQNIVYDEGNNPVAKLDPTTDSFLELSYKDILHPEKYTRGGILAVPPPAPVIATIPLEIEGKMATAEVKDDGSMWLEGNRVAVINLKTGEWELPPDQKVLLGVSKAMEYAFYPFTAFGAMTRENIANLIETTKTLFTEPSALVMPEFESPIEALKGLLPGGESYEEFRKLPMWEQLLYELPLWITLGYAGVTATGVRAALASVATRGGVVGGIAQVGRIALAPVAGFEWAVGKSLNVIFGTPLRLIGERRALVAWHKTAFYKKIPPEWRGTSLETDFYNTFKLWNKGTPEFQKTATNTFFRILTDARGGRYTPKPTPPPAPPTGVTAVTIPPAGVKPPPVKPIITPPSPITGVPTTITKAMETSLGKLGYSASAISKMTPEVAWGILYKPEVFYHGSPQSDLIKVKASPAGDWGEGIYFTTDPDIALHYSRGRKEVRKYILGDISVEPAEGTIYKMDITLKNPLRIETDEQWNVFLNEGFKRFGETTDKNMAKWAREEGYDGIINRVNREGIAFDKKSALLTKISPIKPKIPIAEVGIPEVVKPPITKPPIKPVPETTKLVARRTELKEMLAKPATELPKGITKIALRQELKGVNAKLVPAEKKLRQQIMTTATTRSILPLQRQRIFKDIGGTRYLSEIGLEKLNKILLKVQTARPVKVKGKAVVTEITERSIQSLKKALIGQGKLNEDAYKEIMRTLKLKTDKFESVESFITQADAKRLIRNINYEAEVGLIEYDTKIIQALKGKPEITKGIDTLTKRIEEKAKPAVVRKVNFNIRKLATEVTEEPELYGVNPFFDIQIAIQRLQEKVGGRVVTRLSDVFEMAHTRRLELERINTLMGLKIAKSIPDFKKMASDKKALERIRLYIAAKNKLAGVKSPKDISELEIRLANAIEAEWQGWQNQVRYSRFTSSYYQHDGDLQLIQGDIPNAPMADLEKAVLTYESGGSEALGAYLDAKTWGIIRQGYEFRQFLRVGTRPRRAPKVVFGKSQLKTRTDMTYTPQEKDVLQRLGAYRRRMLNSGLEPYFRKIDMEFARITPKLSNVEKSAGILSLALEELKGFYVSEVAPQLMLRAGGIAFSILSLSPHMFVRNLGQNPALLPDKSALIDPRNKLLSDQELEFIDTYVNQFQGIKQEQLLQRYMGHTRLERMLAKITYYPYSDPINRKVAMFATGNKGKRALKDFQVDGDIDKFMVNSGMLEMSSTEQIRTLEMMAQDEIKYGVPTLRPVSGEVGAVREIAKFITTRKHFRYLRFQRSHFEMGTGGRLVGSLVAFPRGYAQNLYLAAERLKPGGGATVAEKWRAIRVLVSAILGSMVFGALYAEATGKKRNPYHPLNVIMWSPGGLAIGAPQTIYDMFSTLQRVIMAKDDEERDRALYQLTKDIPRMGDMFIPFYIQTMNILEALYNQQYIDRKTLRQILGILSESYELNEEFYEKERSLLGKWQHAIFGGEDPDPGATELAIIKALESIRSEDEEYTIRELASALSRALEGRDYDEVTEDNGYAPMAVFYMESQQQITQYYDLEERERERFLRDNSEVITLLYFWGRWKATMSDEVGGRVKALASKYDIPFESIPALRGTEATEERASVAGVNAYNMMSPKLKEALTLWFDTGDPSRLRLYEPQLEDIKRALGVTKSYADWMETDLRSYHNYLKGER